MWSRAGMLLRGRQILARIRKRRNAGSRIRNGPNLEYAVKRIFSPALLQRMPNEPFITSIILQWRKTVMSLLPLGGTSVGNNVAVYSDGDAVFNKIWSAIAAAQTSIRFETYILEKDPIGTRTVQLLIDAANRGVQVILMYDGIGSSAHSIWGWELIDQLRSKPNATVVQFNPILSWPLRRQFLFRDHRKIIVIDNRIGFTGGMNIGKEYCGPAVGGDGSFRDTHLRVEGPAVFDLIKVFEDSYSEALPLSPQPVFTLSRADFLMAKRMMQQARLSLSSLSSPTSPLSPANLIIPPFHEPTLATKPLQKIKEQTRMHRLSSSTTTTDPQSSSSSLTDPSVPPSSGAFVQVLKSNVWRSARLIQRAHRLTLQQARHSVYISNPYFFPSINLRMAMIAAAQRGVDVRVLLCGEGKTDVPMARYAAIHLYNLLLSKGIRIYELQQQVLHAKTVTIDGIYSSVGSFNFDHFSEFLNLEVTLTVLDPKIANDLQEQFKKDLEHSQEITLDSLVNIPWYMRILHWFAFQCTKLIPRSDVSSTK